MEIETIVTLAFSYSKKHANIVLSYLFQHGFMSINVEVQRKTIDILRKPCMPIKKIASASNLSNYS